MKKVLITNVEIVQYTGSEINCITIAKRFKDIGYEVYIGALDFREPLINEIKEIDFKFINLLEDDFDFSKIEFDIVWAQHSFLLDWLIFEKGVQSKKVITSSLSPKENLECIPLYANDLNMILANSMETKETLEKEGALNIQLFENYSFENYFNRKIEVKRLKNIAVVSNHIPEEEKEAIEVLKDKDYNVEVYGIEGKKQLITDEVLSKYDLIITIGKTVQYAMSLTIPVYIYDKHGGPGYLTMENIEKNRAKNFSGRGFAKKTASQICEEIEEKFNQALEEKELIKKYAYKNFCFEKIFDDCIEKLEGTDEIDLDQIRNKYSKNYRSIMLSKGVANYIISRTTNSVKENMNQKINEIISEKEKMINNLREEIQNKDTKILAIENSKSYKFYNKIKNMFFKRGI